MRSFLIILALSGLFISCSSDRAERNPFLREFRFEETINLRLNNELTFVGGSKLIQTQGAGIRGVIVYNLNGSTFLAWEASCPNHEPNNCSTMTVSAPFSTCGCENYQYSLANGTPVSESEDGSPLYPLLNYSITKNGDFLRISN